MYFTVKFEKTQKTPRSFEEAQKKPKVFVKKPRSQGRVENPKILGENPRSGNAAHNEENTRCCRVPERCQYEALVKQRDAGSILYCVVGKQEQQLRMEIFIIIRV